jgi:hypothetical protein
VRADEPALIVSIALAKHYQSTGTFIIEGNEASSAILLRCREAIGR